MTDLKENAGLVLAALQSGIKFRGELREITGLHYSAINDALYDLEVAGKVEKVETTLKTYYRVAGSGEPPPSAGAASQPPPPAAPAAPRASKSAAKRSPKKATGKAGTTTTRGRGKALASRARRQTVQRPAPAPPVAAAESDPAITAPPPFTLNGYATALVAAAVEFEYQATWGEPSPKVGEVRRLLAEAVSHMPGRK